MLPRKNEQNFIKFSNNTWGKWEASKGQKKRENSDLEEMTGFKISAQPNGSVARNP